MRARVVMAMSGGVDSSTAAALLREGGYEVIGVFLSRGPENVTDENTSPCGHPNAEDARLAAEQLGIPFRVISLERQFAELIDYFRTEYKRGRTPNPCVVCNHTVKFKSLVSLADRWDAQHVASGHYARIEKDNRGFMLKRAADPAKDQSYMLSRLSQEQLARAIFPLGSWTKANVRKMAAAMGLRASTRSESQDICFVPSGNYRDILESDAGHRPNKGVLLDVSGRVLGHHRGIHCYTVGQRRGLGIALGEPRYVIRIDPSQDSVVIGRKADLERRCFLASDFNWIPVHPPSSPFHCLAQIRHNHKPVPATISLQPEGNVKVEFERPEAGIAPGQAVVLYEGDTVAGSGWIDG